MPLQNRVAPDGTLHAVKARGTLTGNRGIIHDPATKLLSGRRWTTRAWIACSLHWKSVRRDVWGLNRDGRAGWSELFFLDEVTALAAGHRPCFACRRADALRFADAFARGNGLAGCAAPAMDMMLHRERQVSSAQPSQVLGSKDLATLPDGTIIRSGGRLLALLGAKAEPWDFSGYGKAADPRSLGEAVLVTPRSIVNALKAGYAPAWHPGAGA